MRVTVITTGTLGISSDKPVAIEVVGELGEKPVVHIHGDTEVTEAAGTDGTRIRTVGVPMVGVVVRPLSSE